MEDNKVPQKKEDKSENLSWEEAINKLDKPNFGTTEVCKYWYVTSDIRMTEILSQLSKFKAIIVGVKKKSEDSVPTVFQRIAAIYNSNIHKVRTAKNGEFWLSDVVKKRISARLKEFTETELIQAIENFSKDQWWLEHCGNQGMNWFFYSPDRIERFLNLQPRAKVIEKIDPTILKLQQIKQQKKDGK